MELVAVVGAYNKDTSLDAALQRYSGLVQLGGVSGADKEKHWRNYRSHLVWECIPHEELEDVGRTVYRLTVPFSRLESVNQKDYYRDMACPSGCHQWQLDLKICLLIAQLSAAVVCMYYAVCVCLTWERRQSSTSSVYRGRPPSALT